MNWKSDFSSFNWEELAQYDNRSGFDLVSCQEVGLPVYKITVNALIQIRKPIPPIEEYVLKTIDAGLSSEEQIAGFLGLELSIIREAMVNLRSLEDIDLIASDDSQLQIWKLTKKGEKTLQEAKIIVPKERNFEINFDGLLGIPRWYGQFERTLLKHKELRDKGIVEIEPSWKHPPELSDLKLKDIDKIIQQITNSRERKSKNSQEQDLLALKAMERRQRFFQPAIALVYQAKDSKEIQVGFMVDGVLSSDHEASFVKSSGAKKIEKKILDALQKNEPIKLAEKLLGKDFVATNLVVPDTITAKVIQAKTEIQAQIQSTRERLDLTDNEDEKNNLIQQLQEKDKQILELQAKMESMLNSVPLRWLEMYEHRPLLEKALKETQQRLTIVSPWIRADCVNPWFLQQIENLLKREVRVFIGYGLGEKDKNSSQKDIQAENELQKLASKYSKSFILKRLGDTHAKILISDTKFAVTSSFNWLSFKGDPDRTFRDERGTLVCDRQKIDELFENLLKRLTEES